MLGRCDEHVAASQCLVRRINADVCVIVCNCYH